MKVRIGFGIGATSGLDGPGFAHVVDELERLRFDSLWVSERAGAPGYDPMVAMTFAVARTTRLKVGASVMVLPGRNPVLLAKAIASLDQLSGGRALPAFGLGIANSAEHQAFGVERGERSAWFNEALPLMRRLWDENEGPVTHHGERFHLDNASVLPKPLQQPLEVWLGGASPAELRRVGRMSDGWLPSFATPDIAAAGWNAVNEAAAAADRTIDPEHFGVLIPYIDGAVPEPMARLIEARSPGADPSQIVASGPDHLRDLLEAFIAVGASKFVLHPFAAAADWTTLLETLAETTFPLQT